MRILARLGAHGNVVRMLEVYDNDSILCIVLEYVAGQTLYDLLSGGVGYTQ